MSLVADWRARTLSPDDAVAPIKSGMKIFIHGAAATPTPLIVVLCKRLELENVSLYHLHLAGDLPPVLVPSFKLEWGSSQARDPGGA
jgi:hypothetical protein